MYKIIFTLILTILFPYCRAQETILESGFATPPSTIQTSVYWYWIDGNISKEGVIKDLESMKAAGVNRAFIGNLGGHGIGDTEGLNVKLFSEEWWDITHTALKKAGELGIDIGIFNSPGWSQAGGPWVKPQESMRYLAFTKTIVKGSGTVLVQLEQPVGESQAVTIQQTPSGLVSIMSAKPVSTFEDVKVIAYPAPKLRISKLNTSNSEITSIPSVEGLETLIDSNKEQGISFPNHNGFTVNIRSREEFTARSLSVYPTHASIYTPVELEVLENGNYVTKSSFVISRTNPRVTVGYEPWAPIVISLDEVKGKEFRVIFKQTTPDAGIAEIELSGAPKVERYKEKIFAKMYEGLTPGWGDYMWRDQPEVDDKNLVVNPADVLDLSDNMSADGVLHWDAPDGEWIVLRTGMLGTGAVNAPAMADATGLEIDKLSKKHIETHFDAFIGKILERIPAEDRKTFRVVVQDSYESGGQNFTDNFLKKFKERYRYDPLPYLPTYFGDVVGNEQESDRFLWDVRRLVADMTAYDYVGGLREVCHKYGLTTWLENYGHFGFPGEFLQYGGQSDEIGGEFWCDPPLGELENRAASSCAHTYGKKLVSSESSTSGGPAFLRTPEILKQRTDRFFTEGINNTTLHVYIHQPDDRAPGLNSWFGTEFNRNNSWFEQMDQYTEYLKRCNYMLRQGLYQADVAYFIGEDAPKMTGIQDPELPAGYQFDYINAEVLIRDAFVRDGRLTLPHGTSYRVLVLPKIKTMRPEMLDKLEKLISDGAIVVGSAPTRSPSLENQPQADQHVSALATKIWGKIDGVNVKSGKCGKGMIYSGVGLDYVMSEVGCVEDCIIPEGVPLLYSHQSDKGAEIYFLTNQGNKKVTTEITFRVKDLQPELWIPTTGETRILPAFIQNEVSTVVPVSMERGESFFIVFRNPGKPASTLVETNFPKPEVLSTASNPWKVSFESKVKQPAPIELKTLVDLQTYPDDNVKYFSGRATYKTTIDGVVPAEGEIISLNLSKVASMAKVKVNNHYAGGVWTYPFRLDVTQYIKKGKNQIEIEVVNTWVNRMIGDMTLPECERETNALFNPYDADSNLVESGLIGPVTLEKIKY